MRDFLSRLGLVFHWTGFIFGIIVAVLCIFVGGTENIGFILFSPVPLFASISLGYLLRWVMVGGDIKFFPYLK